jgi:hypothetical protein
MSNARLDLSNTLFGFDRWMDIKADSIHRAAGASGALHFLQKTIRRG